MPTLNEVNYSREACINAIREYYRFLTKMFLDEDEILEPPEGGWPDIMPSALQQLGKTEEVAALLRSLPYLRTEWEGQDAQATPWGLFANWTAEVHSVNRGKGSIEDIKVATEGVSYPDDIPAHVVGLTSTEDDYGRFLLDTELGVIYWMECEDEIANRSSRRPIRDDPYDYAEENETEWRAEGKAWAIADFFEVLKEQFRKLKFIPINGKEVKDVYEMSDERTEEGLREIQGTFREHGWPDLSRYRKHECMAAVREASARLDLN
ncbi:hypothetical protein SLS60_001812 [Paraconiothyrium brasiliense]|uniref:Uncharacterized protein n=1 Tax=Paraconiothyrium brasiliense TaxID=300254 RepID=A0ABR3S0K9_9PLEO